MRGGLGVGDKAARQFNQSLRNEWKADSRPVWGAQVSRSATGYHAMDVGRARLSITASAPGSKFDGRCLALYFESGSSIE